MKAYILYSKNPVWINSGNFSYIEGVILAESKEEIALRLGGKLIDNTIVFSKDLFKNQSRWSADAKEIVALGLVITLVNGEEEVRINVQETQLVE